MALMRSRVLAQQVITEMGPGYSPLRGSQGERQLSDTVRRLAELDHLLASDAAFQDAISDAFADADVDNFTDLEKSYPEAAATLVCVGNSKVTAPR